MMMFSTLALLTVATCVALVCLTSEDKTPAIPLSIFFTAIWMGISTLDAGIDERSIARIQNHAAVAEQKSIEKINTLLSMSAVSNPRETERVMQNLPTAAAADVILENHKPLAQNQLQLAVQKVIEASKEEQLAFKKKYQERKEDYERMTQKEILLKPGIALGFVKETLPAWSDTSSISSTQAALAIR